MDQSKRRELEEDRDTVEEARLVIRAHRLYAERGVKRTGGIIEYSELKQLERLLSDFIADLEAQLDRVA